MYPGAYILICIVIVIPAGLFDIPRYESRIESLHVLFTLYSAIKNSQFRKPEDT